ncbi:MAG: zinc ribbon domain-containing protein [Deltaproteobacteria bacterium]|nr:zinc ribbon domain-containing protein [Deltaproteobacteria bacterium]
MTADSEVKPRQAAAGPPPAQAPRACHGCGEPLGAGALFCERCGAAQPGAPKCPHCRTAAKVSSHPELRCICYACGAPRISVAARGIELSGKEIRPLRRAREAWRARLAWRIGGAFGAAGTGFVLLATALAALLGVGIVGTGLGVLVSLPFLLLALLALARSRQRTADVVQAIDDAWKSAARDVAEQAAKPIAAADLGAALGIEEEQAEGLLAALTVDDELEAEVTDQGRLSFGRPVRIAADAEAPAGEPEAEVEQALDEQAKARAER